MTPVQVLDAINHHLVAKYINEYRNTTADKSNWFRAKKYYHRSKGNLECYIALVTAQAILNTKGEL